MKRTPVPEPVTPVQPSLLLAVAGNPNVGKSTLFNGLSGAAAETAHFPGVTVATASEQVEWGGHSVELVDLPGTYGLGARSEDERLAWEFLLTRHPDVVIAVVDACNLARSIYVVLQMLDMGLPLVVAVNMADEAERRSLTIDVPRLARELGVHVVRTVALEGEGVDELRRAALAAAGRGRPMVRTYSAPLEKRLATVGAAFSQDGELCDPLCPAAVCGLGPRGAAFAVTEGFGRVLEISQMAALVEHARCRLPQPPAEIDDVTALQVANERHRTAARLAEAVAGQRREAAGDRWWRIATAPRTGVPLLLVVLTAIFGALFYLGGLISNLLTHGWDAGPAPLLTHSIHALLGSGVLGNTILWGINGGVFATLAVGVPYIMTFYLMMAVLEDTGYVNAVAYLTDRLMRRFGLQGRAVIPLIAAGGCNVPAIMGARVLTSKRERIIASTLITLVPCSARTAVIVGAVSLYAGWQWALFVYAVVLIVGVAAGLGLNRLLPGKPGDLVMEMFPLRRPSAWLVVRKTWARLRDFVWVAAPIIIGGSVLLGALYESGLVWHLTRPLSPVVEGWLGLPAVAGLTLLFAVLRKELALQLLVALAVVAYGGAAHNLLHFMTVHQLVVYALVSCLYVPCASTIAVLGRELGWKVAGLISAGTLAVALVVGGAVAHVLPLI
jgi:ferrous iron transport protein B